MALSCFICNILVGDKDVSDLFAEYTNIDESVAKLLTEIVEKPVTEGNTHSYAICKQCYSICLEYDSSKKRMQEIKTEITNTFKLTLPKHGMDYNTYPKKLKVATPKKIVLPASKLQPLPPNYVIDVSKLPKNVNISNPTINLKVTVGSTVLTQSIKSTQSSPQKTEMTTTDKAVESNIANSLSTILGVKTSTSVSSSKSMLTFEVNDLPKDFMSKSEAVEMKKEMIIIDDDDDDINNDEQPMEIDEDCTITKIKNKDVNEHKTESDNETVNKQFFDVSLLPINEKTNNEAVDSAEEDDDDDDDNDDETAEGEEIMLEDESGSVIKFVVSGQKLVYENGTLTLADDEDSAQEDNEDHDSADEAQIELQVSGDEETANAIIAAAQEQGGAFIKVESGEMFRVKSVKSQHGGSSEELPPPVQMVAVHGEQYQCLICDRDKDTSNKKTLFDTANETMQHLRGDHDARVYICHMCKKIIRRRSEYNLHIVDCSADTKPKVITQSDSKSKFHECTQCTKKFTSRTLLKEHMNVHNGTRPYTCSICKKSFASKYTHQAHLKTHLERPRPYKCKQCTKTFMTQQNLSQHEKTHLGVKDFVCNLCGKAFGTQHNLEVHGVVHSKNKPFVCAMCGKAFARRAEVKDHMRIHTGERPYACDICSATFTQRSNLNSHKRATHMDDRRYACTTCHKRFKRRRLLDYHMKVSHTGERPLECKVCHATFVYPEHYKKHARIHSGEKPYVCEVCGKSFNSRDNRNTHRFVHSDKKPYECLVCGAGYMRKQLLYAHMNSCGHLAESIVVNQPRVQKVSDRGLATIERRNTNKLGEELFPTETSEELELSTSGAKTEEVVITETQDAPEYILQDSNGKTQVNIVEEADDPALFTFIHNLDGSKADGAIQGISAEQLGDQVQMVTADESGNIRVVQLQLGTNNTWMMT